MNEDTVKGQTQNITGKIKEQWGKLTDDDIKVAEGKKDQLVGKVQEKYGVAKDEASKQVDDFYKKNNF